MAGANPQLAIRIAANVEELKRNLAEGRAAIEALGPSVEKMAATWKTHSSTLIQNAHNITAAIDKVGVSTLTAGDASKSLKTLDAAMAQLARTGQPIPGKMTEQADALRKVVTQSEAVTQKTSLMTSAMNAIGPAIVAAFSVGAVVRFAQDILRTGDELTRMADRTGMTTTEVQRMSFAASQSGNTIDELVQAIGQMQNRLASGDASAVGAVKALHLGLNQVMAARPADQMAMLAEAIGKIEDPSKRAQIAMDLFGKSGIAILPTLTSNYKQLAAAAPVMSAANVKALDDAGDAIDKYVLRAKVFASNLIVSLTTGMSAPLQAAIADAEAAKATIEKLEKGVQKFNPALSALPPIFADVERETTKLNAGVVASVKAHEDAKKAVEATLEILKTMKSSVEKTTEPLKYQTVELLTLKEAWQGYASQTLRSISDIDAVREPLSAMEANLLASNKQLMLMPDVVSSLTPKLDKYGLLVEDGAEKTAGLGDQLGELSQAFANLSQISGGSLGPVVEDIGKVIGVLSLATKAMDALEASQKTGAASWVSYGSSMLSVLGAAESVLSMLGAWNDNDDTIGRMAALNDQKVAYINLVLETNKLVGGTRLLEEAEDRLGKQVDITTIGVSVSLDEYKRSLEEVVAKYARLDEAMKKYGISWLQLDAAGKARYLTNEIATLYDAWASLTDAGVSVEDATKGMSDAINQYIIDAMAAGQTVEEMMAESESSTVPFIQSLIDMGLLSKEAAAALSGKLAPSAEDVAEAQRLLAEHTQAVVDKLALVEGAAASAYGVLTPAMKTAIEDALKLNSLTDDQTAKLTAMLDAGAVDYKALEEKAAKYGITLEGLGPQFQQANISRTAMDIVNDFQLLTGAGADAGGVLLGMKDEISAIVNNSVKFGSEIPLNMKPMIDELIRTGQLTDAAGNKFTDTSKFKFSGTDLATTLGTLAGSIAALVKALSEGVPSAIDLANRAKIKPPVDQGAIDILLGKLHDVPSAIDTINNTLIDPVHVPVIYDYSDDSQHGGRGPSDQGYALGGVVHAALGGIVQAAQYAAAGARILPFPGGPRGTDTVPAWLTPGEGVVTTRGMQSLGGSGLAALNRGDRVGPAIVVPMTEVVAEIRAMRAEAARREATAAQSLARIVRDEVQKVARR